MNRLRTTTDADGFTLIEAVVSFVIFAIIAVSATAAIADSIKVSNSTRNRVTASNLAQQAVADARSDEADLMAHPDTPLGPVGVFSLNRTATSPNSGGPASCAAGASITVTITVTWSDEGTARTLRMDSLIAC